MPGSGIRTFLDPDLYETSLRRAQIGLIVVPRNEFKARLTWAELHHLQLLRCEEDFPRIGYLSFPPRLVFIGFPVNSLPRWRGVELQSGDVMLHSLGERFHQTTPGSSIWNMIALNPAQLEEYSRVLFGKSLIPPPEGRVLRPSRRDAARLRRLHAQACRLAETKPKILAHPEVARAIEQDLIHALVTCLIAARVQEDGAVKRRHASIMIRFEEVLAKPLDRLLHISELCQRIGVNDQTLRSCCAEFLGTSPTQYVTLRRLKEVRRELCEAEPNVLNVAELARRHGFTKLGRFAAVYQATFGETPTTTLRRPPEMRFRSP